MVVCHHGFICTYLLFVRYGPGVGADMRTPLKVGMNGGLSLRTPRAMLHCLVTVTPEMVNDYRLQHGLVTVPYNPIEVVVLIMD